MYSEIFVDTSFELAVLRFFQKLHFEITLQISNTIEYVKKHNFDTALTLEHPVLKNIF